jgi:LmbE family N-acetylglucosaminyl deacetylase
MMMKLDNLTALVIAPHPDDEVFGCGGLIHRIKNSGGKVYVLYMTVGTTRDFSPSGESSARQRLSEVEKAAACLSLDGYAFAFPGDQFHLQLDAVPQKELIHAIERGSDLSLQALQPDIVLTTSNADYNQDHRAVSDATLSALRPASPRFKSFQPVVLTYELPYHQWNVADTLHAPTLLVRLEQQDFDAKIVGIQCYGSQLKAPDSPLSVHGIQTLASYRGLQCGAPYAEAFQIRRLVL